MTEFRLTRRFDRGRWLGIVGMVPSPKPAEIEQLGGVGAAGPTTIGFFPTEDGVEAGFPAVDPEAVFRVAREIGDRLVSLGHEVVIEPGIQADEPQP